MEEITESAIEKFEVESVKLKPPIQVNDIVDIEIILTSDDIPVNLKGYTTLDGSGNFIHRVYTFGDNEMKFWIGNTARKKIRQYMDILGKQLNRDIITKV